MPLPILLALWGLALAVTLYGAEKMVQGLSTLGHRLEMSAGLLGLLVALGADGPEVTSAFVALSRGSSDVGLGVVVGSNIYNLAGLLGLAAVLARGMASDRFRLTLDGGANLVLTLALVAFLQAARHHVLFGALLLLLFLAYVALLAVPRERLYALVGLIPRTESSKEATEAELFKDLSSRVTAAIVLLSLVAIIGGSDLLVNLSLQLGPSLGVPTAVLGTFILPIATSLPNTWAAISLARRGLASAAVAATFNSNSINVALGTGIPAMFLAVHASHAARTLDGAWLLSMTITAIILLATRRSLSAWDGCVLIGMYAAFVVVRLSLFS
jgi:cation:H+ antiporter